MKKKVLSIVLLAVLCCFTAGFAACNGNNEEPPHEHTYSSVWSSDGKYHWHVATCGHDVISDKAEHNGNPCTVCGYESIPEHEHTFSDEWESDETYHWHPSTCGHDVVSGKAEHIWDGGVVTKEPTCTEKGEKTYTCTVCDKTKKEEIAASGHTFSDEWESDETYHWHPSTCGHDVVSGKAEHIWDGSVVTKEPTCTEQGYTFYVCDCGDSYKDNYVEALGHDFKNYVSNNDATYETDGTKTAICERDGCNEKDTVVDVGSMLHKHNYSSTIIEPTCTEQGYTFYVCDCGDSYKDNYVEALGHDFKNYVSNNDATYETDGTKTAICERDGCNEKNTIVDEGTKIEKVKIVFNSDGGTAVESIIEYPNTEIVCPENPIKENYLFKKWQLDGKDYTFTTMPEKDIELTAVWEFYEDGTKLYPFVIECKEDYFEFVNNINKGINTDKYYILKNDIDFEGQPVNSVTEFSGVFDGRNFELRNAIIAEEVVLSLKYYKGFFGKTTAMGLFIRLNEKAIIMNTRLINFSILNEDITANYVHVGGLVSINLGGTIKNCQTKGTIEIRQSLSYKYNSTVFAGGLIGSNGSMIIVSSVTSSGATTYEYISSTSPSVCEESYSNVSIDDQSRSSSSRIGGLCGHNSGTICTSFSLGKIGSRYCSGGLVGENYGQISNCFSKATVVSSDSQIYSSCYAGGLVGINNAGKISFCYASGNVSASGGYSAPGGACAGGLVGFFESGNIYSCLAINLNISCNDRDNIDAFVGDSKGAAAITNSFYYGASNVTSRYAEECLHMQLNDKSFYINTLGWDNMIWDLNELNILTSNAPQLNWYLNEIVILRDR